MPINQFSNVYVPEEYQAPFDLNVYGKVMQEKQMRFDTNLTNLQGALQQIADTTDIYRPQDRAHFQDVLTKITNDINKYGLADLGNTQVSNYLQGLAKTTLKDKDVVKSMLSTRAVRLEDARKAQAQKTGKWSIANDDLYNEQINKYMKDPTVGASFGGQWEDARDLVKDMTNMGKFFKSSKFVTFPNGTPQSLPPGMTPLRKDAPKDQVDAYNAKLEQWKNSYQFNQQEVESLDYNGLRQAFTYSIQQNPDMARQIWINGKYQYKQYGADNIAERYAAYVQQDIYHLNESIQQAEKDSRAFAENDDPATSREYARTASEFVKQRDALINKISPENRKNLEKEISEKRDNYTYDLAQHDTVDLGASIFSYKKENVKWINNTGKILEETIRGRIAAAQAKVKPTESAVYLGTESVKSITSSQFDQKLVNLTNTEIQLTKEKQLVVDKIKRWAQDQKIPGYEGLDVYNLQAKFENDKKILMGGGNPGRFAKDAVDLIDEYNRKQANLDLNKKSVNFMLEGTGYKEAAEAANLALQDLPDFNLIYNKDGTKYTVTKQNQIDLVNMFRKARKEGFDSVFEKRSVTFTDNTETQDQFKRNVLYMRDNSELASLWNAQQDQRVADATAEAKNMNLSDYNLSWGTGVWKLLDKHGIINADDVEQGMVPTGDVMPMGMHTVFQGLMGKLDRQTHNYEVEGYKYVPEQGKQNTRGFGDLYKKYRNLEILEDHKDDIIKDRSDKLIISEFSYIYNQDKDFQKQIGNDATFYLRDYGGKSPDLEGKIAVDKEKDVAVGVKSAKYIQAGPNQNGIIVDAYIKGKGEEIEVKSFVIPPGVASKDNPHNKLLKSLINNPYREPEANLYTDWLVHSKTDPLYESEIKASMNSGYNINYTPIGFRFNGTAYKGYYLMPDGVTPVEMGATYPSMQLLIDGLRAAILKSGSVPNQPK